MPIISAPQTLPTAVVAVLLVLVVIKRTKRGRKVLNSSCRHMKSTSHFSGYSNASSVQNEGVELTSVIGLHDVCKDDNYNIADSGIALSSTYNVIREENLHDRGKSPYDVIITEDLSDIGSGVYDVARKENMNNSADATRSPYVVVSSEYLPPPGYESVTATTSSASLFPPSLEQRSSVSSCPIRLWSGYSFRECR
ncbi:uncharacterized protein LOC135340085 isoform X2 [Halichondria panicea]